MWTAELIDPPPLPQSIFTVMGRFQVANKAEMNIVWGEGVGELVCTCSLKLCIIPRLITMIHDCRQVWLGGGQKYHVDIVIPNIQPKADFHLCFQANL